MPITLKEALVKLESGAWISLRFITANMAKGSGGKVVELAKCRSRQQTANPSASPTSVPVTRKGKSPSHHEHFTRNVELQNKQVVKVHPILITHINNIQVI